MQLQVFFRNNYTDLYIISIVRVIQPLGSDFVHQHLKKILIFFAWSYSLCNKI